MTGLENSYVAEMNVHLARWRLKNHMRADRRCARGGLECYDRAEKKTFAIHVVGVQSRRVGLTWLLGARRNGKQQDGQEPADSAGRTSYKTSHVPSHSPSGPTPNHLPCAHSTQ